MRSPSILTCIPQMLLDAFLVALQPQAALIQTGDIAAADPRSTNEHRHDGDDHGSDRDRALLGALLALLLLLLRTQYTYLDPLEDTSKALNVGLNAVNIPTDASHLTTHSF